jgi:3-oxoacyl-[acyl-carrier protein] reductase
MFMESSNPVAIITGAGRGIGRAAAIDLAGRAYRLALVSRTLVELEETACLAGGGEILVGDVSNALDVQRILDLTMARYGRVDALIHCAGVAPSEAIDELSIEQWRQTIDTNLSAIFYFCRLLFPIWRSGIGGVVVNVSSYAARDPFPGLAAYGAAKAGVNLLGLALAREGQRHKIRVHTVAPAATETAMFRSLFSEQDFPKDKTLDPAEVARVIGQCVAGDLKCTSGEVIYVHKS